MIANIHPETGIRYGVIASQSIHSDIIDSMMSSGLNVTNLEYLLQESERIANNIEEGSDDYEDAQSVLADIASFRQANKDEVVYGTKWLEYLQTLEGGLYTFLDNLDEWNEDSEPDECTYIGYYEGVKYSLSTLGGAYNIWVEESPVVGKFEKCSPCCPNAVNLNSPDEDGEEGYDVPADWRVEK